MSLVGTRSFPGGMVKSACSAGDTGNMSSVQSLGGEDPIANSLHSQVLPEVHFIHITKDTLITLNT